MAIRTGTTVKWKWGSSWAEGTVQEVHRDEVSRSTKGEKVTRKGSDDDPAYVIEAGRRHHRPQAAERGPAGLTRGFAPEFPAYR